MQRRMLAAIAGVAVAGVLLAGCSGTTNEGTGTTDKLVWWSEFSEGEPMQVALAEIVADFEDETGIEVDVQWKGVQPVKQLLPSLTGGTPPIDLVDSYHGEIVRQLGSVGAASDLTDLFDQKIPGEDITLREALGDSIVRDSAGPDGGAPYISPFIVTAYGFLYNKATHPEIASAPPQTWDDFYDVLDSLKADGRQPLALDGSLVGNNAMYFVYFTYAYGGTAAWFDALADKSGAAWESDAVVKAAEQVERIVSSGYFLDGYEGTQYPGMQQKWANNESDFLLNHSGVPSEAAPYTADGFAFDMFPFPGVDGKKPEVAPVDLNGFGILEGAKNEEAAKQFILFTMKKENQEKLAKVGQIPARADVTPPSFATGMQDILQNGDSFQAQYTPEMVELLNTVFYPNDDDLIFGKIGAAEFVERMKTQSAEFWSARG